MKPRNKSYIGIVHSDNRSELLRVLTPREKWKFEYRQQRLAKKGSIGPAIYGEVGSWQGLRIYGLLL